MYREFEGFVLNPETQAMLSMSLNMFVELFVELTLLFLLISYLVSVINQKLPKERIQSLLGSKSGRGYFSAAMLGAITPFCSWPTIPMLIGLLRARAGFGPTMTFLFTSPLLNPLVIALFIPVLGLEVTLWYAALALSASVIAGLLLEAFGFERYIKLEMLHPQNSTCATKCGDDSPATEPETKPSLWSNAWKDSWTLFKTMFPYMLVAMLIGSIVHGFVPADFFAEIANADNPAAIPAAALIGIPLYIRVTALLPLIGAFVAKGVSMGAIIALVIGSGGASLPELILLKRIFYWPLLLAFLLVIFSMAILGGFAFNYLIL